MQIFFRLGKHTNIAYAELVTYLKSQGYAFEVVSYSQDIVIVEFSQPVEYQTLIDALGSTVKVGEVIGPVHTVDEVRAEVMSYLENLEGKKVFGFSLLTQKFSIKDLNARGIEIKKELGSARFVTSKEKELSSVIVKNEKLLKKGGEFILFDQSGETLVGVTKAVQDFKAYEARDVRRPRADDVSGMIPVKLAQTMINLLGVSDEELETMIVADPFCGSGTILQEFLVKGFKNVIGSDVSEKAIDDSSANLEWLSENYTLNVDNVALFNIDAKELGQHVDELDGMVTEPYLGPPLRGGETKEVLKKNARELEDLYMRVFKTFGRIMKKGSRIVIVVPAFKYKDEVIYLDIFNKLESYGFKLKNDYKTIVGREFRYPLMYYRPDAKILREILVFEKR
jgi:tRNA G10  N-methylase Trm11